MRKDISNVVLAVSGCCVRSAVKFLRPNYVVRATRRLFRGKVNRRGNIEILLTMGKPNYREREFVKMCKKAGQKFPISKIQLKPCRMKNNA